MDRGKRSNYSLCRWRVAQEVPCTCSCCTGLMQAIFACSKHLYTIAETTDTPILKSKRVFNVVMLSLIWVLYVHKKGMVNGWERKKEKGGIMKIGDGMREWEREKGGRGLKEKRQGMCEKGDKKKQQRECVMMRMQKDIRRMIRTRLNVGHGDGGVGCHC